jgi:hypothetical protein
MSPIKCSETDSVQSAINEAKAESQILLSGRNLKMQVSYKNQRRCRDKYEMWSPLKFLLYLGLLPLFFKSGILLAEEFDKRQASMVCNEVQKPRQIKCDYRYDPKISVQQMRGFIDAKEIQLDSKVITAFPSPEEKSAVLIMIDVSDNRRAETIKVKVIPSVKKILDHRKVHQSFGLAVFDSEVKILTPFISDPEPLKNSLSDIKVVGLATELYKSLLTGIDTLKKQDAQRKILIIFSDGKAEDTSFSLAEVLGAAKDAGVSVLSVGHAERGSDAAYLQNLQKLASDTFGFYIDSSGDNQAPDLFKPLQRLEAGGRVVISAEDLFGDHQIQLALDQSGKESITLTQRISMSDSRPMQARITANFISHWYFWMLGFVMMCFLGYFAYHIYRKRRINSDQHKPYAALVELDLKGTRHLLSRSATRLGRGRINDLKFTNDTVSTNHAEIHRQRDGSVLITDLSSSNGILVNNVKVAASILYSGDVIEIGEVRLRYEKLGG